MLFTPKGYLPLTTAVDQLAGARRPAGQANNDGKNAARAELRAEFYSDLISPLVVSRSGKNYKIRPYHWGGELAPTWLLQGECLLKEGLVDPPLGMFHPEERATIFISEHDFQRLKAEQATKQEAAPPPGRGRKKGAGSYAAIDLPLLNEMKELILSRRAASPEEAARMLAKKAHGFGSEESKTERLAKRYRKRERA
jgi:hypothetical protein